jgi:hypothetical protein
MKKAALKSTLLPPKNIKKKESKNPINYIKIK